VGFGKLVLKCTFQVLLKWWKLDEKWVEGRLEWGSERIFELFLILTKQTGFQ
jgi:hypothetical protein